MPALDDFLFGQCHNSLYIGNPSFVPGYKPVGAISLGDEEEKTCQNNTTLHFSLFGV